MIVSDDAGYNEFSMQGSMLFPTPRIDSIAANGVRFWQGYTSGAVCSPTRAGLMTGRYQNRFGHEFNIPPVYSVVNGLSLEETTLAEALGADGYRTIALGKWHLGYAPQFHPPVARIQRLLRVLAGRSQLLSAGQAHAAEPTASRSPGGGRGVRLHDRRTRPPRRGVYRGLRGQAFLHVLGVQRDSRTRSGDRAGPRGGPIGGRQQEASCDDHRA